MDLEYRTMARLAHSLEGHRTDRLEERLNDLFYRGELHIPGVGFEDWLRLLAF